MAHRDFDSKEKNNLFNNIYLSLKQDILWLRLKPGTLLTETYLADKFEISKTPIREALMRLSYDGLVTIFPRKGYCVSEISFSDIKDMHEYRYILENTCLIKVTENISDEESLTAFPTQTGPSTAKRSLFFPKSRSVMSATASFTSTLPRWPGTGSFMTSL